MRQRLRAESLQRLPMSEVGNTDKKSKDGVKSSWSLWPSHPLHYYALLAAIKMISHMPFWLLYVISDILFFPVYYIGRYRRRVARRNLTESFPDKSLQEIKQIEKKFYHFFIDMILESCKLISISPEAIKRRMKMVNMDKVNKLLGEGKSVSLFLGHYGNWEWISTTRLWVIEDALKAQIYHQLNNPSIDELMRRMRERLGGKCVDMNKTVQYIINARRSSTLPNIIGFIADQSPRRKDSKYFVKFLNHEVPVLTGTEKLTKHFGFEAFFISVKRLRRGYYECTFSSLHDDPKSLPDFELTDLYYQRLEQEIQEQPEYYLWTHNRFRYGHQLQ